MHHKLLCTALSVMVALGLTPLPAFASQIQPSATQVSTQAMTEKQTALGLFKDIRDNSEKDTPAYIDAQCAIDILTGTMTSDVTYPAYQGPSQSATTTATNGASNADAYKTVDFTNANDAVALSNVKKSVDWINTYNAYRANENSTESTTLATDIGTNCRMMAISIVQCDWSKATLAHSRAFDVGENLSWGYSNPFDGWYTEEKALFKEGKTDEAGHYLNIVDYYYPTSVTGFATCTNGALYGVCHEQSFYTFTYYPPNITYSTDEFAKLISDYETAHNITYDQPTTDGQDETADNTTNQNGNNGTGNTTNTPSKTEVSDNTTDKLTVPTIKLSKKTKTVKTKAVKKKAQSFNIGAKTNSTSKISYKVTKKNKRISFKNGKVTLKKGTKKGKYSITVKASVKQTSSYAANTETFKLTFNVR